MCVKFKNKCGSGTVISTKCYGLCLLRSLSSGINKKITFLRHGLTEANKHRVNQPWGSDRYVEIDFRDTKLSRNGIQQTLQLNEKLKDKEDSVYNSIKDTQLIISSPLTRALQTSELVLTQDIFPLSIPRVIHPLARERLYLSSEIGNDKKYLKNVFSNYWDYSYLPNGEWWYNHDNNKEYVEFRPKGQYICKGEPEDIFKNRIIELKKMLLSRKEVNILVVCHWAVIRSITGTDPDNCEFVHRKFHELLTDNEIIIEN